MAMETTLRDLARAYTSGKLDKVKYRAARKNYVEGVVSGSVKLRHAQESIAAAATTSTDQITRNPSDKTTMMGSEAYSRSRSTPQDKSTTEKSGKGLIYAGVAVVVIVVIALVVIFSGKDEPAQAPAVAAGTSTSAPSTTPDATPSSTANLIRGFLGSNNWSQPSLDKFVSDWQALPEADRTSSMSSVEIGQLSNAIYKKLLEERALSGIGNPETSLEKQRLLVEFAAGIGIQDQKISLPESQATATP
jgi:hypothetical protein